MADEIIPTETAAAPIAETASPVGDTNSMVSDMMKDFAATSAKEKEAANPTPKPEKTAPKSDVKPVEPKTAEAKADPTKETKPAVKGDVDFKTAPEQFRKAHEKLKSEYDKLKLESQTEKQSLTSKMAELEKKRYWTPEDEQKNAEMEARYKQLVAEQASRDYTTSDEYKQKYVAKFDKAFQLATSEVKTLMVKYVDDGEDKVRPATDADFQKVLHASVGEARRMAREMFGEDADLVLAHRQTIRTINDEALQAVAEKKANYEVESKTKQEMESKSRQEYGKIHNEASDLLIKNHPEFFAPDEQDPDATAALKKGFDFIDSAMNDNKATPQQMAVKAATIRAWAGAFPRLAMTVNRLKEQLASKDAELLKFRKTDPGELGGEGGEKSAAAPNNSSSMADAFKGLK